MRSKFLRNLASFNSIDKMGLPPLSDSSKIYHIYAQNPQNYPTRTTEGVQVGQSAMLSFCGVQTSPSMRILVPRAAHSLSCPVPDPVPDPVPRVHPLLTERMF